MSSPGGLSLPRGTQSRSRNTGVWTILIGGGVVTLLLLGTCGRSAYNSYRTADDAVARFHEQLDSEQYEEIYGDATDEFRNASSRQQQITFFKTVREKMGNSGKRSIRGFHVNVSTNGTFVNAAYRTEFGSGPADETFVWRMDEGKPRLWSYHIDSPNLR